MSFSNNEIVDMATVILKGRRSYMFNCGGVIVRKFLDRDRRLSFLRSELTRFGKMG